MCPYSVYRGDPTLTCLITFYVYGAIGCGPKKLDASVAVPAPHVRVPSQSSLPPSVMSVTSAVNVRVIMK